MMHERWSEGPRNIGGWTSRVDVLRPWPSKGSKLFLLTFGLSLLWIGGFAFLLVWWTDVASWLSKATLYPEGSMSQMHKYLSKPQTVWLRLLD